MGLSSTRHEDKKPYEIVVENSMYTILRDARNEARYQIPLVGEDEYIKDCLDLLRASTCAMEYPLKSVEYRVIANGKDGFGDVMLFVPVVGNGNIFAHMGSVYRPHGILGTEGRHLVTLHYREAVYLTTQNLRRLFDEDVDLMRQYLLEVESVVQRYRDELAIQLRHVISDMPMERSRKSELVIDLDKLGFRRRH